MKNGNEKGGERYCVHLSTLAGRGGWGFGQLAFVWATHKSGRYLFDRGSSMKSTGIPVLEKSTAVE